MNVGIVGCGNISDIYLKNLTTIFKNINVYACADLDENKVKRALEQYKVPNSMTLDEMLNCEEIDAILNRTAFLISVLGGFAQCTKAHSLCF